MSQRILALVGGALALALPAVAHEHGEERGVDLSVERSRDVANDQVTAIVAASEEGSDPAALADRVNQTMAWAQGRAHAAAGVTATSGGYSTYPVHDEGGRLRAWRASQELVLEAADVAALSGLLGELQSRLALQSISFSVSDERRRKVEDELISEALGAFRARADLVRGALGARGYQIARLSVDTGGARPMPRAEAFGLARADAAVAPPAFEPGTSRMVVTASGRIELE